MTDFLEKIKEKINNKLSPEKVLLVDNSDLHKNHKQFDSKKFNLRLIIESKKLRKIVEDIKKKGLTVAGYGAAAKGLTILKCSKLGKKHISYFVDDSPAKQGFYTPVDHIPIISRKEANKKLPDYFIILAPNYSDVIIEKESEFIKKGGKFIIPKNEIKIV